MKKIKEQIITVVEKYKAIDGTIFNSALECEKYENTAKAVINSKYNAMVLKSISEMDLFDTGSDEYYYQFINLTSESQIDDIMMLFEITGNSSNDLRERLMKCIDNTIVIGYNSYDEYYCLLGLSKDIRNKICNKFII